MPNPLAGDVDELLVLLEAGDRAGARALARALHKGGTTTAELIAELLAPAQRGVGDRWQRGTWDVAQEHLATGIVDGLLAELELRTDPAQLRGDVVVSCAEGEWHALPARMLAEQLRHQGWAVTFLGPSVPAADLGRFVLRARPVGVAISCSISAQLGGAQRSIEAVHDAGGRAVVGGPTLGVDDRRAVALGADAWAPGVAAVDAVLARWAAGDEPHPAGPLDRRRPDLALAASHREVVDAAAASFDRRTNPEDVSRLDALLRCTGAALLTDDPTVLHDHVEWLRIVVAGRGDPVDLVDASLTALAGALPVELGHARRLLLAARGAPA